MYQMRVLTSIIDDKCKASPHVAIVDKNGEEIKRVKSYNIETKEAEIYILKENSKLIDRIDKTILIDSKLMFKK